MCVCFVKMSELQFKDLKKLCIHNLQEPDINIILNICKDLRGYADYNRAASSSGSKFLLFPFFKTPSDAANAKEILSAKGYKIDYANTRRPDPQPINPSTVDFNEIEPYGICIRCGQCAYYNCARCDDFYCSIDCQKTDWPVHKLHCFPMPELVPSKVHTNLLKSLKNVKLEDSKASEATRLEETNHQNVLSPRQKPHSLSNGDSSAVATEIPTNTAAAASATAITATINFPISQSIPNNSEVWITYVRNHQTVYIRSVATDDAYKELLNDCAAAALTAPKLDAFPTPKKDMVLAKYERIYYRGMVLACNTLAGLVRIAFVDFGNTEEVPFSELKVLSNELCQRPRLILIVHLKNVNADAEPEQVADMKEYLEKLSESSEKLKVRGDGAYIEKGDTIELLDIKTNQSINAKLNRILDDMYF